MHKCLKISCLKLLIALFVVVFIPPCGAQAYLKHYDPQKGFRPASRSLTTAFLKLAASLEHHGSPEPYIRYVLAEHARIDGKYRKATGKASSARPEYFTDEYLANLLSNWKKLEKPLQLDQLCRDSGRYMRHAIRGSWHKTSDELVAEESNLNAAQKKQYRAFLMKAHFKKSDFAALEAFYEKGAGFENLSQAGKDQMSQRVWLGTQSPDERDKFKRDRKGGTSLVRLFNDYQQRLMADINDGGEREVTSATLEKILIEQLRLKDDDPKIAEFTWNSEDAVRYAHLMKWEFTRRWKLVAEQLDEAGTKRVSGQTLSMVDNLRILVNSELLAAINESSIKEK